MFRSAEIEGSRGKKSIILQGSECLCGHWEPPSALELLAWSDLGVAAPTLSLCQVTVTVWLYLLVLKVTAPVALIQCSQLSWASTPVQFSFLSALRNTEFALTFLDSSCSQWFPGRGLLLCLRSLAYFFRLYLGILD